MLQLLFFFVLLLLFDFFFVFFDNGDDAFFIVDDGIIFESIGDCVIIVLPLMHTVSLFSSSAIFVVVFGY